VLKKMHDYSAEHFYIERGQLSYKLYSLYRWKREKKISFLGRVVSRDPVVGTVLFLSCKFLDTTLKHHVRGGKQRYPYHC